MIIGIVLFIQGALFALGIYDVLQSSAVTKTIGILLITMNVAFGVVNILNLRRRVR